MAKTGGTGMAKWMIALAASLFLTAARADEIKVMSTVALTPTLSELAPKFEKDSGHKLAITYSTAADLKKRVEAGETADVLLLTRPLLDALAGEGKLAAGSVVNLGKSYVAIGVRAGAKRPDISTPEKLKAAILAAKSISYADPANGGYSGVVFAKLLESFGIAEQVKAKTTLTPSSQSVDLVAAGEVELDAAMASELAAVPGTQIVGPLPGDYYSALVFAGGIPAAAKNAPGAKALLDLLTGPAGLAVLQTKGMDRP